jgi:hypothetical protein
VNIAAMFSYVWLLVRIAQLAEAWAMRSKIWAVDLSAGGKWGALKRRLS